MEDVEEEKVICIREVNENIRRVETGQPLTRSLKVLNCNCDFKRKFNEMDKIICGTNDYDKEKLKKYNKEYREKPGIKEKISKWNKEYLKRPEVKLRVKEYAKEYKNRPEVKARLKKYYDTLEFRARMREYEHNPKTKATRRRYYLKKKKLLQAKKNDKTM